MAISRKGLRRIVVDGVEYHWRSTSDWAYHRAPEVMIVEGGAARGEKGDGSARVIRFAVPWQPDRAQPGWWNDLRVIVTPSIVARAIRVAARRAGSTTLTIAEVFELLDLDRPRPEDRLRDLEAALGGLPKTRDALVKAVLAIGCHGDRGELIDDWFACHADALLRVRGELQAIVDGAPSWNLRSGAEIRSAIAFFAERCERVGLEIAIETGILDARLVSFAEGAPWGIPSHHGWWRVI